MSFLFCRTEDYDDDTLSAVTLVYRVNASECGSSDIFHGYIGGQAFRAALSVTLWYALNDDAL